MAELISASLRLVFLGLTWLFIAFAANVIRTDIWGRKVATTSPEVASTPVVEKPRKRKQKRNALTRLVITQGRQAGLRVALDGVLSFGLEVPRDVMDARIAERVRRMWAEGFVEEVRRLAARGLRDGVTASKALGYRQLLDFLDGRCTEDEAREATINRTRRFARKQLGWFRRDARIAWRPAGAEGSVTEIADAVGLGDAS